MISITYIYLVENCYGDPNKVYIGKEKSHQKTGRKVIHRRTYGEQIKFNYIDQCLGWNKKSWEPLETYWIEQFRQWGFEIMNHNKKGGGGPEYHTLETRQKMSKPKSSTINMKHSEEIIHRIAIAHYKPIIQYDLNNNLIKEWPSVKEAAKSLKKRNGGISSVLTGVQKTAYGYQWKYK